MSGVFVCIIFTIGLCMLYIWLDSYNCNLIHSDNDNNVWYGANYIDVFLIINNSFCHAGVKGNVWDLELSYRRQFADNCTCFSVYKHAHY